MTILPKSYRIVALVIISIIGILSFMLLISPANASNNNIGEPKCSDIVGPFHKSDFQDRRAYEDFWLSFFAGGGATSCVWLSPAVAILENMYPVDASMCSSVFRRYSDRVKKNISTYNRAISKKKIADKKYSKKLKLLNKKINKLKGKGASQSKLSRLKNQLRKIEKRFTFKTNKEFARSKVVLTANLIDIYSIYCLEWGDFQKLFKKIKPTKDGVLETKNIVFYNHYNWEKLPW